MTIRRRRSPAMAAEMDVKVDIVAMVRKTQATKKRIMLALEVV